MTMEADAPLVRIAELEIDPARLAEYKALLTSEIEASVATEPGVLALHAVSIADRPTSIRIFEIYASREAYATHLQAPHFLSYKRATASMVQSLTLYETEPIALASKPTPA